MKSNSMSRTNAMLSVRPICECSQSLQCMKAWKGEVFGVPALAGSVETTNAQGSVIAARDAVIQARVNYGSARVSAYRALGIIDQLQ